MLICRCLCAGAGEAERAWRADRDRSLAGCLTVAPDSDRVRRYRDRASAYADSVGARAGIVTHCHG